MKSDLPKNVPEWIKIAHEELKNYQPTKDEEWDEETRENWNAKMESVK